MKKQDLKKLREMSLVQLQKEINKKKLEIEKARAEMAVGKHKDVRIVKKLRHDLAQVATILKEKETR